jgi:hypothetical protein
MLNTTSILASIPIGLRDPLIAEYNSIVRNFMERRWMPAELSGGRFSEIVYTILDGYARGSYAASPSKPADFVKACRTLEGNATSGRSFQILIPRMLPALYEIRNNRDVGHVGGDVNPNHMDAEAVLAMASWVMAELVRVFHSLPVTEAQSAVDLLVERKLPLIWSNGEVKRILRLGLALKEQIMLLAASEFKKVSALDVFKWTEYGNRSHFNKTLRQLHQARMIELDETAWTIEVLPPGTDFTSELVRKLT